MWTSIDFAYKGLVNSILKHGHDKPDRTGTGCRSRHGLSFDYDMVNGFPLISIKKTFYKSVLHELLWFLSGNTNIYGLIKNNVNIWTDDCYREFRKSQLQENVSEKDIPNKECFVDLIKDNEGFREEFGDLGPVYGAQWVSSLSPTMEIQTKYAPGLLEDCGYELVCHRPYPGRQVGEKIVFTYLTDHICSYYKITNQIEQLIHGLRTNPYGRRHLVNAWAPGEISNMALPPCHYSFQFIARPNNEPGALPYLDLLWNQRSVDVGLGLPFNIASYATLLVIIARLTGMIPGVLMFRGGDVHIYNNHLDQLHKLLAIEPKNTNNPWLIMNPEITDKSSINDITFEDFFIEGYDPHPHIKLELST